MRGDRANNVIFVAKNVMALMMARVDRPIPEQDNMRWLREYGRSGSTRRFLDERWNSQLLYHERQTTRPLNSSGAARTFFRKITANAESADVDSRQFRMPHSGSM